MLESLSNKVTGRMPLCLKETPTKVFSCQYCEIFENSFFTKHLWQQFLFLAIIPILYPLKTQESPIVNL